MEPMKPMKVIDLLEKNRERIVGEAAEFVSKCHLKHYEEGGEEVVHQRLTRLFDLAVSCAKAKDAVPMLEWGKAAALERFSAGFDLQEVQTAVNALEAALWQRILAELDPADFAEAIGVVSTVLGMGKDALAREFVALAARREPVSLDLSQLFAGTEAVPEKD